MKNWSLVLLSLVAAASGQVVPIPDTLVLQDIPPIQESLRREVSPYLEFRAAGFNDWHPERLEMLITTRFADTPQLHYVSMPGGARRQLTFSPEPVAGGLFQPRTANFIVLSQDIGGGEFYQLFRFKQGKTTLLTDGKSRNTDPLWARSGKVLAYMSTRRNGADTDLYVMDPAYPKSDRMVAQLTGGGWAVEDFSPDETRLLVSETISINLSQLHLIDIKTGALQRLTPETTKPVVYANARFSRDGRSLLATSDLLSEFAQMLEFVFPRSGASLGQPTRVLSEKITWDVDSFDLSEDGKQAALLSNEAGASRLYFLDLKSGRMRPVTGLPTGVYGGVKWHNNSRQVALTVSSAKSPSDVFAVMAADGKVQRWTESETGGLDASQFPEPELVRFKSFDGLEISAFVYRADPKRFPGKRPVLVNIHGGPESQSRPVFQARNNYYMNEMGITMIYPNVRGSSGYGKTFVTLDNGFKREDSVKDIGALLDWISNQADLDNQKVGVIGGSYGGYMVLASMIHYADRLKCGVDVVGISNFLTFLKNTQDYRRDLRRVEYGDERDPAMRDFLAKIAPTAHSDKIRKPLLVVQGKNDPRVPVTESEQMVQEIKNRGGEIWYLAATDEGHGFRKKKNADYQFLVTIQFLRENLLN